jgi:hypothetical protein
MPLYLRHANLGGLRCAQTAPCRQDRAGTCLIPRPTATYDQIALSLTLLAMTDGGEALRLPRQLNL